MSIPADRNIVCRDCQQPFVFSVREQEFFAERGFGDPVRCVPCRRAHKAKRQDGAAGPSPEGPRAPASRPDRGEGPRTGPAPAPRTWERAPTAPPPAGFSGDERGSGRRARESYTAPDPEASYPYGEFESKKPKKKRPRFYEAEPDDTDF